MCPSSIWLAPCWCLPACLPAEMRKELKESRNFANETWKHHLVDYSKDEVDWEILNLVREAELHNTQWMLGQVSRVGVVLAGPQP